MKWIQRRQQTTTRSNDDLSTQIAKIRGISVDAIDRFLRPTKDELHSPYSMKNITDARDRIIKAIHNGENVVISLDNDMDGISSGVIMYKYLKNYLDNVDYIYSERAYGHGIEEQIKIKSLLPKDGETLSEDKEERLKRNKKNVEKIKNCDLLIIVDSSSNDVEACKSISEILKKDIIILDHHEIEEDNPYAILVNPQQEDCEYPNKHLSGAGVVYKTIETVEDTLSNVDVTQYMDLVAVGMYADLMKVDNYENRYLIMNGLRNIKNIGLTRILKSAKVDFYKINCDAIGFNVAPMLNGVSRMNQIQLAIDMLLADDDKEAQRIQRKMKKINVEKKAIQQALTEEYQKNVNTNHKILVVVSEQSSRGFNGVIAQQLSSKYKRPTIVGRVHEGVISGSCRSYGGLKMKTFLKDLDYVECIGHEEAFGISFPEDRLDDVISYFNDNMEELDEKEQFVLYDLEIDASAINNDVIRTMEQWNLLYGNGFNKVIIKVNNITIDEVVTLGETKETRKFKTMNSLELIKFKVNEEYGSDLTIYDNIEVVGVLQLNEFFNFKLKKKISTPQILLQDFRAV